MDWTSRTELLLGAEALSRLRRAHVLVVGVGGVGAATAEMLVRAGVGEMTLVDADVVQDSNRNRQLIALKSTVGKNKVDVAAARLLDIQPELSVHVRAAFLDADNLVHELEGCAYDFIVDAIDTLAPKMELIRYAMQRGIPIVSAMGAGAKTDPSAVYRTKLSKTVQCPLAKMVRKSWKEMGLKGDLSVVSSNEPVHKSAVLSDSTERNKRSVVGTVSYMPIVFACHLSAYVLEQLTKEV